MSTRIQHLFGTAFDLTATATGELATELAIQDPDVYALDFADAMRAADADQRGPEAYPSLSTSDFDLLDDADSDAPRDVYTPRFDGIVAGSAHAAGSRW